MRARYGILLCCSSLLILSGCDTSPKPKVTPQLEVAQPAADKDKANKTPAAAGKSDKEQARKEPTTKVDADKASQDSTAPKTPAAPKSGESDGPLTKAQILADVQRQFGENSAASQIPALAKAKTRAAGLQSANNLKQLALAMQIQLTKQQSFPARAIYSKDGKPLLSWRVGLLPEIGRPDLYKQFHLDEPWDGPNNKPLIAKMPAIFTDPTGKPVAEGKTRYVVPVGKGTVFDGDKGTKIEQITDGTANTLLIVEAGEDKAVTWTQPDDMPFDPEKPMAGLGTIPGDGFYVAFADGSVRHLRKDIDAETFRRLILRADGEVVDLDKL